MTCPHCGAPLKRQDLPRRHILACQRIELGLLQDQVTPVVANKPLGWKWA